MPLSMRPSWPAVRVGLVYGGVALVLFVGAASVSYRIKIDRVGDPPDRAKVLEKIREKATGDPHRRLGMILGHNLVATLMLLIVGVGTAGTYAAFAQVQFGVYMGSLIASFHAAEISNTIIIAFLLPHGIIEIPALCLAAGVGLRGGAIFFMFVRKGGKLITEEQRRQLIGTAIASLLLIVVAAFVEAYLTPPLALGYLP